MMSIGFGAYGKKSLFGELVDLSPQMQELLPGATLESGYSISGPDDGGYFGIKGPALPTPAFTSGRADFRHPLTQQLLFKAKANRARKIRKAVEDDLTYSVMGWVLVGLIVFMFIR